ncbi:MAG: hypothetical protein NVSMB64_16540 [Candidatus Velthaea sp.]
MSSTSPIDSNPRYLQADASAAAGKLQNLSAIIDDRTGAHTPRQQEVATGQRIAREYTAYGYLAASANTGGSTTPYLKAYAAYYDRLTPEEQQTERYRGTGDAAKKALAAAPATSPPVAASRPDQAIAVLTAQQTYDANNPLNSSNSPDSSTLAGPDLLSGLRSLLGIIQDEQHPAAPPRIAIPPHVDIRA